ncbi:unnamed protein product [Penicillium roqueforti FM164]|uniref:Genomic scaffold, ProqFM164S04 n=1 Tax=Penicillium roqueforti (strain FM164) TaxID=1365484 RepID=W6QHN1_PENRF|nr:unnamed protein product [Penicillium roqueforti FM164]
MMWSSGRLTSSLKTRSYILVFMFRFLRPVDFIGVCRSVYRSIPEDPLILTIYCSEGIGIPT